MGVRRAAAGLMSQGAQNASLPPSKLLAFTIPATWQPGQKMTVQVPGMGQQVVAVDPSMKPGDTVRVRVSDLEAAQTARSSSRSSTPSRVKAGDDGPTLSDIQVGFSTPRGTPRDWRIGTGQDIAAPNLVSGVRGGQRAGLTPREGQIVEELHQQLLLTHQALLTAPQDQRQRLL